MSGFKICFLLPSNSRPICIDLPLLIRRRPFPEPDPPPDWIVFHEEPSPQPWVQQDLLALAALHDVASRLQNDRLRIQVLTAVRSAAEKLAPELGSDVTLEVGQPG